MKAILQRSLQFNICIVLFLLFIPACAHFQVDSEYAGPMPLPDHVVSEYSQNNYRGDFRIDFEEDRGLYVFRRITIDSGNDTIMESQIKLEFYDIKSDQKKPVIIVLPVLEGAGSIIKDFAKFYAENGYASIIVNRKKKYVKRYNFNEVNGILKEVVLNHKQVIDWIETRNDLDKERIGVFGISFGGIKSALISQLDNRISASVLALAGGDLPYILSYSNENTLVEKREEFMQNNRATREQLYDKLTRLITCDPINYAKHMDARNTMMILAIFDKCVPFVKGRELRRKIGNPETVYLFAGHYTSILYKGYVKRLSLKFFRKKFR